MRRKAQTQHLEELKGAWGPLIKSRQLFTIAKESSSILPISTLLKIIQNASNDSRHHVHAFDFFCNMRGAVRNEYSIGDTNTCVRCLND